MLWIAPTEKDTANAARGKRFWDAADQRRVNSGLKSEEYSASVLDILFLRFTAQRAKLEKATGSVCRGRVDEPSPYHAERIQDLLSKARFDSQLNRPNAEDIGTEGNLWLTSL